MNANNNNHTNGAKTSEQLFSEAPASWNTRYLDPNGFECQITLRGESGSELLEKAASAIAYLLKNGCTPYVYRSGAGRKDSGASETQHAKNGDEKANGKNGSNGNPAWCSIHQCEMKRWDINGASQLTPSRPKMCSTPSACGKVRCCHLSGLVASGRVSC